MKLRKRKRHVSGLFMLHAGVACMLKCQAKREITSNSDRLAPAYLGGEIWRLPRYGVASPEEFFSGFHRAERDEYVNGGRIAWTGVLLLVWIIEVFLGNFNVVHSEIPGFDSTQEDYESVHCQRERL